VKKLPKEKFPPKNEFPPLVFPAELFPFELFRFELLPVESVLVELFLFPLGGPTGRPLTVLWNGKECLLNQFEDPSAALAKPEEARTNAAAITNRLIPVILHVDRPIFITEGA
jgi:hypothetical protein